MKTQESQFQGVKLNGILMLILNLLKLFAIVFLFVSLVSAPFPTPLHNALAGIGLGLAFVVINLCWLGFMLIEPNEARVMVFFGRYKGTVKENGFFWVNPFYSKQLLTLRARNLDASPIKVNDRSGNPIMIGMVLVWRLFDTYRASFHVDNASMTSGATPTQVVPAAVRLNEKMRAYEHFVKIQCDAALRHVAGMFAYDCADSGDTPPLTLRASAEEINKILEEQINERLAIAGIEVVEARINYLAYAPEIAAVMLRRQQADAIIAARERIVDGAVGMVKLALDKLSEGQGITLDQDQKAAMVSNLMVVLCSEDSAQPVINAGTLHH